MFGLRDFFRSNKVDTRNINGIWEIFLEYILCKKRMCKIIMKCTIMLLMCQLCKRNLGHGAHVLKPQILITIFRAHIEKNRKHSK